MALLSLLPLLALLAFCRLSWAEERAPLWVAPAARLGSFPTHSEHAPLTIQPEVVAALSDGRPVVALESTIISHGMPFPQNLETAKEVEEVIRKAGAVPATVAVLDGHCFVGLTPEQLERLAKLGPANVAKCSRRDLAAVVARRGHGATTVSATMLLAHRAGIDVFVTGGVGGVHRGGEASMDVSADLSELGRTPVCVVSAGIKSILDIPRTLEVLETSGVAVAALGTDEFPAFFTRNSGCPTPLRVEDAAEAAALVHASLRLGLDSGMLVAVPIPAEAEAEAGKVQSAIETALGEASAAGIEGRDVTPFLLRRVNELTGGASLAANIALIKHNALQGARIALELAQLRNMAAAGSIGTHRVEVRPAGGGEAGATGVGAVVVVGGTVADIVGYPSPGSPLLKGTSTPGRLSITPGGVGRNIAEALARLGSAPVFLSAVGDDTLALGLLRSDGLAAQSSTPALDMSRVRRVVGGRSATYAALHSDGGDLAMAVADMDLHRHIDTAYLTMYRDYLRAAPLCIVDANLCADTLRWIALLEGGAPVWLEPVSEPKAAAACIALARRPPAASAVVRPGSNEAADSPNLVPLRLPLQGLAFVSPNEGELIAMVTALRDAHDDNQSGSTITSLRDEQSGQLSEAALRNAAAALVRAGVVNVIVTRGPLGILWARSSRAFGPAGEVSFEVLAPPSARVKSTRGAGDTFVAGVAWGLLRGVTRPAGAGGVAEPAPRGNFARRIDPYDHEVVRAALRAGLRAAQLTVESDAAVAETLTTGELERAYSLLD